MINFRYFKTFNGSGSNPNYYIYLHIVDFYPVLIDIITSSSHIEYLQVLLLYICNPDLQYVYKPYNIFTTIFTAFILHTQTYFTGPLHEASQHLQCKADAFYCPVISHECRTNITAIFSPRPHGYKCIKTTLSLRYTAFFSWQKTIYWVMIPSGKTPVLFVSAFIPISPFNFLYLQLLFSIRVNTMRAHITHIRIHQVPYF